jgi:hypothetical protein
LVAYGYRLGEVPLPRPEPVKDDLKIRWRRGYCPATRKVQSVSLGCHVRGLAEPHPDTFDPATLLAGGLKRAYALPPTVDVTLMQEFQLHVRKRVRELFPKLASDTDVSVETWLSERPYPLWRKEELLDAWRRCKDPRAPRHYKVGAFGKDETYPEYKHARLIHARKDVAKCRFGPIFSAIEKIVFRHPYFIKKVPVVDRARYIRDLLGGVGRKLHSTDYSSFEAWFTEIMMRSCERELYSWMVGELPEGADFLVDFDTYVLGKNVIETKFWKAYVEATRMSGEMCTSLGNGFSNWMITDFLITRLGGTYDGVFEGDDGAVASTVWPPDSDFARLGMKIKAEEHTSIEEMSFCGLIFDSVELCNITDPISELLTFGWTNQRYSSSRQGRLMCLLRAKALSSAHLYRGAPILAALARYGLRVTRSYDIRGFLETTRGIDQWHREQLIEALQCPMDDVPVGPRTRLLMERKFGISVEAQMTIESYLDSLTVLTELHLPILDVVPHPGLGVARDYFKRYVEVRGCDRPTTLNFPYSSDQFNWAATPKRDVEGAARRKFVTRCLRPVGRPTLSCPN